jgi:hypothetical protein
MLLPETNNKWVDIRLLVPVGFEPELILAAGTMQGHQAQSGGVLGWLAQCYLSIAPWQRLEGLPDA